MQRGISSQMRPFQYQIKVLCWTFEFARSQIISYVINQRQFVQEVSQLK